ncbi:Radical SAM domain protein [Methanohalobium evestigatum Z-7303]|uniref:Radical SAM domain protein n=1 Tax=Methanohalobium evestigatum (strain ATCC BAA-1072 / DSM 3721 / NBRC 107634 / OCM 161 / Z-7303) TaxID=644295 RepID=D7E834_METEZ|nr:radical SAM protein [Methanohalobium evestigatum]ADI73376.1 Radical SAM domain protein [Methanohalobium evestigatum Z-7303]
METELNFAIQRNSNSSLEPWEINNEGQHGALVLRYRDCNLSCYLCYFQPYAYLNRTTSRRPVTSSLETCVNQLNNLDRSIGWVRIQGGEPLLNDSRSKSTSILAGEVLNHIVSNNLSSYENPRIIIQTNGIWLGNASVDKIDEFVQKIVEYLENVGYGKIVLEISFKGSNREMANSYAKSINTTNVDDVLATQISGYNKLHESIKNNAWDNDINRLAIYPIAGFGPEINNPGIIPIQKIENSEYPIFHPDTWDENFSRVIDDFRNTLSTNESVYQDYLNSHGNKIPMESMEPRRFQSGWIARINDRPQLRAFAENNLRIIRAPRLNIFMNNIGFVPEADENLIQKVGELREVFYEADPKSHYPYL